MDQEVKTRQADAGKIKKVPLKAELVVQLKALEKEHEELKLEHAKNLQVIKTLEMKVDDFVKQKEQKQK